MADVPKDLLQEIKRLEELFTVPTKKLKEITTHFVSELEKGSNALSNSFPHQSHSSRINVLAPMYISIHFLVLVDACIFAITRMFFTFGRLIKSDIKPGLSVEGGSIVSTPELCLASLEYCY